MRPALLAAALSLAAPAARAASTGAVAIGSVTVDTANVFDLSLPGDDFWAFRLANRIHFVTAEGVVRRELLFDPGEPFEPLKAIETERNLRSIGFIRSASVVPSTRPDGGVDLAVRTQDSWTLTPLLSVGTEGGSSYLVYGISEGNLLGLGKQVSAFRSEKAGSRRSEARYGDPRFARTDFRLLAHYAATDRGDESGVRLSHPFYSHDTPWAAEASWARVVQDEALYRSGGEATGFTHDFRAARGLAAVRLGSGEDVIHRVGLAARWERNQFSSGTATTAGTVVPGRRDLAGPAAVYALIEPRYIKAVDIDHMKVVEDYNLGWELGVEGGPLPKVLGSDRDRWALGASLQKGLSFGEGRFGLVQAVADGRAARGILENGVLTGSMNLFWKTGMAYRQTLVTHMEYTATKLLDTERQVNLGGDTGLRGYKNNAFQGARALTVNFEDRLFFDRNLFRLLYMGAAGFVEAGSAIPQGAQFFNAPWKADLGLGLRFSSSRSASGGVFRVDVAYALNGGPGGARWVVTAKGGQAFSLGGSVNRPLLRRPDAILADDSPSERLRRR